MSSVSVLSTTSFKNGAPHGKVHVLQESINNLANTNNVNKGDKREIIILRKKPKLLPANLKPAPQTISVTSLINNQNAVLIQNPTLISAKLRKVSKPKETAAKNTNPLPIAVARRNARERNRVKQVNNGFATLRQHIPNEIAEIYENAHNKSANKKLSKVETLRMAVDYIRSLERLLDGKLDTAENNINMSLTSFPSPASSESLQNSSSFERSYLLQSPLSEEDDDSNPSTPLPPVTNHHYSRIPGTNTFQLIAGPALIHQFEDEENVHPLTPNSDLISQEDLLIHQNLIDENIEFMQSSNQQFTVIPPDIISSDFYSDSSLSPHQESDLVDVKYDPTMELNNDQQGIYTNSIIVNTMPLVLSQEQLMNRLPGIISVGNYNLKDDILLNSSHIINDKIILTNDLGLKLEPNENDERYQENGQESRNNMDDVITWWQSEQNINQK